MRGFDSLASIVRRQNPARVSSVPDGLEFYPTRLPVGIETQPYATFWHGNQLPGMRMLTPNNAHLVRVQSPALASPQFAVGTFGQNMGQLQTSSFIARMHQLWLNASTR